MASDLPSLSPSSIQKGQASLKRASSYYFLCLSLSPGSSKTPVTNFGQLVASLDLCFKVSFIASLRSVKVLPKYPTIEDLT